MTLDVHVPFTGLGSLGSSSHAPIGSIGHDVTYGDEDNEEVD
jgi:hypothetical protein